MATLTVYPDAGTGATTVDGIVARDSVNETFSVIRAGAGTSISTGATFSNGPNIVASSTTNQFTQIIRDIFTFDTSSVGVSSIIRTSTLSLSGLGSSVGLGTTTVEIVASVPASNNTLVNADYGHLSSVSFASIAIGSYSTSAYNDFTLNAGGISNVSLNGISKFGAVLGWDLNNSFTGVWASAQVTQVQVSMADTAGTTADPKLVINTYDPPILLNPDYSNFPKPPVPSGRH